MINVFIIDDHPIFIEGVIASIAPKKNNIDIVGTATSAEEGLEKLISLDTDIVLLDLLMPVLNGAECCRIIKKNYPRIKVIILTGELDTVLLYNAWMNNADAIILKYSGKDEVLNAINSVIKGNRLIGNDVPFFFNPEGEIRNKNIPRLTKREEEVLVKLAQGLTRKQTGEALFISPESVNFHCKNIYRKFGKHSLNQVLAEARKLRIIQ